MPTSAPDFKLLAAQSAERTNAVKQKLMAFENDLLVHGVAVPAEVKLMHAPLAAMAEVSWRWQDDKGWGLMLGVNGSLTAWGSADVHLQITALVALDHLREALAQAMGAVIDRARDV